MEQDFLEEVSVFREQVLYGKEQAKRRKLESVLKFLDQCKFHGGPVKKISILILEDFTLEDLQFETVFVFREFFFNCPSMRKPKSQFHVINHRKNGLNFAQNWIVRLLDCELVGTYNQKLK